MASWKDRPRGTAEAARELGGWIARSRRMLVFTGAGISTGSGIPDFRGPSGVWTRRKPVMFEDFMTSEESRVEHWDYKLEGWEAFRDAQPNAAHKALALLDRMGKVAWVVTQNIDGLHQAAGHSPEKVLELHGTNRAVECLSCGRRGDPEPAFQEFRKTRRCPRCACGGLLKTATVSFGQQLPPALLAAAFQAAKESDLVVSIGSTLTVEPAASVPRLAQGQGTKYAIINQGPTAHDEIADLRLEGDATDILPLVVAETQALLGGPTP